jgi:hypothetical protein
MPYAGLFAGQTGYSDVQCTVSQAIHRSCEAAAPRARMPAGGGGGGDWLVL